MKLVIIGSLVLYGWGSKESFQIGFQWLCIRQGFRGFAGRDPYSQIENSGCWCFLDNLNGRSIPVSEVDAVCQELQRAYECAALDNGGLATCVPWETEYRMLEI